MSTKTSVASSKWRNVFNFLFWKNAEFRENKVIGVTVNVSRRGWVDPEAPKRDTNCPILSWKLVSPKSVCFVYLRWPNTESCVKLREKLTEKTDPDTYESDTYNSQLSHKASQLTLALIQIQVLTMILSMVQVSSCLSILERTGSLCLRSSEGLTKKTDRDTYTTVTQSCWLFCKTSQRGPTTESAQSLPTFLILNIDFIIELLYLKVLIVTYKFVTDIANRSLPLYENFVTYEAVTNVATKVVIVPAVTNKVVTNVAEQSLPLTRSQFLVTKLLLVTRSLFACAETSCWLNQGEPEPQKSSVVTEKVVTYSQAHCGNQVGGLGSNGDLELEQSPVVTKKVVTYLQAHCETRGPAVRAKLPKLYQISRVAYPHAYGKTPAPVGGIGSKKCSGDTCEVVTYKMQSFTSLSLKKCLVVTQDVVTYDRLTPDFLCLQKLLFLLLTRSQLSMRSLSLRRLLLTRAMLVTRSLFVTKAYSPGPSLASVQSNFKVTGELNEGEPENTNRDTYRFEHRRLSFPKVPDTKESYKITTSLALALPKACSQIDHSRKICWAALDFIPNTEYPQKRLYSKPKQESLNEKQKSTAACPMVVRDERHMIKAVCKRLMEAGDVEPNPGPHDHQPEIKLTLVSQNCRGLKDERKLKHLLNNCHRVAKSSSNFVIALQETMITDDRRLRFGWRGTHIFTPGTGHGRGCVTLLPSHIQPDTQSLIHLGQRGHIFKAIINQSSAVLANIYAPNGQNRDKIEFFSHLKREIERLRDPTDDVYIMGDFNTVFEPYEVQFRTYSTQEQRHSRLIKQLIDSLALEDVWQQDKVSLTWRQTGSRKSSRLDRVYYQHCLEKTNCTVDWTFTNSDHGAVMVTFSDPKNTKPKTQRQLRLNPELLNAKTFKETFMQEYSRQVQSIPGSWNPHQVLEFHKCAMRSVYIEVNRDYRSKQRTDYDFVKEDLHSHIASLEGCKGDTAKANRLMEKINRLKAEITRMNLERGTNLANKLKTKWYNEGERSNKYFLALLRRKEANGQLTKLTIDNREVTEPTEIEKHVTDFYCTLYNQQEENYLENERDSLLERMEILTEDEKEKLIRPLTLDSLYKTLRDTNDSCPGPDGIPYSYLKATWNLYGPVLLDSWHYSMQTKTLPLSHKTSLLRLIPKAGKNVQELKNWRPITLSNCDHKIITKTLSKLMSSSIERIISGNQTAYLRGRSISDNLRVVNLANNIAKKDPRAKGLLIALDAKKAFDSVSHRYIKEILKKIGLESFIATFDLLYNESQVDISINDKICRGYTIGNGVKQGDALSCTLFILAMEPLLRNIEANREIGSIKSTKFGVTLPKCLGYADDINILTNNSINSVRAVMREYEKFSKISGLHLNADKTEIFRLTDTYSAENYIFTYRGERTVITNTDRIKVNGIELTTDIEETHKLNFEAVKKKVDNQLASWSNRGLSILGKILIYKTYGLSQIIYVTRVLKFTKSENSMLRNLIYKFIWNTDYQVPKAPDRIRRQYLTAPIKKGGFGMIDHESVITAMNTKQVLVNRTSTHPLNQILRTLMSDPDSDFNIKMPNGMDGPGENYADVIKKINGNLLIKDLDYLQQDRLAKDMLLKEKLRNIARPERKNCIELTLLRHRGITTLRQLLVDPQMTNQFRLQILHYSYSTLMDACILSPTQHRVNDHYIPTLKGYKLAQNTTSRDLRQQIETEHLPIDFKIGIDRDKVVTMLPKINKLKCIRAKTLALRLLHGDIYTGTRLLKFGLTDSDECSKCRQSESLEHLLNDCWYTGIIWSKIITLYKKTDSRRQNYERDLSFVVGARLSKAKIKLHLEIIRRLCNKDRPKILPKALIEHSLDYLIICDTEHYKYYKKLRGAL